VNARNAPRPPGGTTTGRQALTGTQLEAMTRAAHTALNDCGVIVGPSRVARIIRRFAKAISRHGYTFHEFLTNEAALTAEQQHRILGHPEWARCIAYADPTGEHAVNRVMNSRYR
jgi:hypothetical protein